MMELHSVANLFPLMSPEEYAGLVADIRIHGLREPIWTHEGKIIDGRNRYKACLEAGVDPRFQAWDGTSSLVAFVVSLNVQRRHLTSSQKAVIALDVERELAQEAKQRQGARTDLAGNIPQTFAESSGEAREQAARLVGTNRQYVSDVKKLSKTNPEAVSLVRDGSLTIPEVKRAMRLPESQRANVFEKLASGEAKTVNSARRAVQRGNDLDLRNRFYEMADEDPTLLSYESAVERGELKVVIMHYPGQAPDERYPMLEVDTIRRSFTGQTWNWPRFSGAEISPIDPKGRDYHEDVAAPLFSPDEWDEFLAFDEAASLEDLAFPGHEWFNWSPRAWRVPFRTFSVRDHWAATSLARRNYDLTYGCFIADQSEPTCGMCKTGGVFVRQGWGQWQLIEFNDGDGGRAHRRYFLYDHAGSSLIDQARETVDPFAHSHHNFSRLNIWRVQPYEMSWASVRRKTIAREEAIAALEADLAALRTAQPLTDEELEARALDWLQAYTPRYQHEWREGECTYPRLPDGSIDVDHYKRFTEEQAA